MKRLALAAGLLGGSLLLFSGLSLGHGGTYRGPGDTVPPGGYGGQPGTPTQPGPVTPIPTGPTGPTHPAGPGAITPPGGGGSGPGMPGGITTPMMGGGPNLESWTFWWSFNRERFLNLKAKLAQFEGPITFNSGDEMLGGKAKGRDSMRPTKEQVSSLVVPALKRALERETNRDVVTGALIALAKIGEEPPAMLEIFKRFLKNHGEYEIAETAALAIGILASADGINVLSALVADDAVGRMLCDRKEVPWRIRAFSAYGLGLCGAATTDAEARASIRDRLLAFLDEERAKHSAIKDVRVAAVIALGLIPDPDRVAIPKLETYFAEFRKKQETVCAHIPTAIARLLRGAPAEDRRRYAEQLVGELSERSGRSELQLRPSFAQALGLLTRADDPHFKRVFEVIRDKVENEIAKNVHLAYFGLMALGEIAGTDKPGNAIEKYLLAKAKTPGGRVMTRAWAALALGVAGFEQAARRDAPAEIVGTDLVEMMEGIKDPEQLGAYAIALGLLRYQPAAARLSKSLDEVKSDEFRGYFATALGLMGDANSKGPIKALVEKSTLRPELLRECSIALGLLGDKSVLTTLVDILKGKENKTLAVQAAVATALGFVGDYRAIDPLIAALEDKSLTAESRAFAGVALGVVCDKEELPWNAKISADLNYMATVETLNDQGSQTGILNLL